MDITVMFQFCSKGEFRPGQNGRESWFERSKWKNQYGHGRGIDFNLIWFCISLESFGQPKKTVFVEATVQEALDLTDDEAFEIEERLQRHNDNQAEDALHV